MPSTEVYILGQKYTIRGDAPEEHIQSLAREIDRQITEVCAKFPNISSMNALILTIFNMAEELHKLRVEQEAIAGDLSRKTEQLTGLLE
jgi:cell division protein ZapA